MKKQLITLSLVAILIIITGVFIYSIQNKSISSSSDSNTKKSTFAGNSKYIEYSQNAYNKLKNTKRVLFFYASWCPTCRPVDESIKASASKIPEDYTIIRVNYDDPETDEEEKKLAQKFNITYQHTFVQLDENENEVSKWNGGGLDEILRRINL